MDTSEYEAEANSSQISQKPKQMEAIFEFVQYFLMPTFPNQNTVSQIQNNLNGSHKDLKYCFYFQKNTYEIT